MPVSAFARNLEPLSSDLPFTTTIRVQGLVGGDFVRLYRLNENNDYEGIDVLEHYEVAPGESEFKVVMPESVDLPIKARIRGNASYIKAV
jgi:hypothetical protein